MQYTPYLNDTDGINSFKKPRLTIEGLNEHEMSGVSTMSLFPNFAWIMGPKVAIIYLIDPQGISRNRVRWDWLVPNTEAAKSLENLEALINFFDNIQQEDLKLLIESQNRIQSFGYRPGRLSPTREVGTHLFQQLIMQHITAAA